MLVASRSIRYTKNVSQQDCALLSGFTEMSCIGVLKKFIMMEFSFELSAEGLKHIPSHVMAKDFEFVVNGKSYWWNSLLADFLSPKIARIHSSDPACSRFVIESNDENGVFESFLGLSLGKSIDVNSENALFLQNISRELENGEMIVKFVETQEGSISSSNVVDRLVLKSSFNLGVEEEVEFVASHFFEIERESLHKLSFEQLRSVLSSSSLKLDSEDQLFDFIVSVVEEDESKFSLFNEVFFENLSVDRMKRFCEVSASLFSFFDSQLWSRLSHRLCLSVEASNKQERYTKEKKFEYKSGSEMKGIIHYLSEKCGGNVHDKGIVEVTGENVYSSDPSYAYENVADLEVNSYFFSNTSGNASVCYNFKNMKIIPTGYAIRSFYSGGVNDNNWKSWVIEVSNDGSNWTQIDSKTNNNDVNDKDVRKAFSVQSSPECTRIRIRQTGQSHAGNNYILFSGFEIFGTLIEE